MATGTPPAPVSTTLRATSSVGAPYSDKGVKIPKAKRDAGEASEPGVGPGAYISAYSSFAKDKRSFGRSKRERQADVNEIGPGAYRTGESDFGKKRGYTIARRYKEHGDSDKPGPGQYNFQNYVNKEEWRGGIKIPKAEKKDFGYKNEVGPGAYDLSLKNKGGFSFQKDKKEHEGGEFVPGPGAYELKQMPLIKSIGKFGKQKRDVSIPLNTVGPGAYNTLKDEKKNGLSFGKAKKDQGNPDAVPGPGQYNSDKVDPLTNAGSFNRQKRGGPTNGSTSSAAGPGAYDLKAETWTGGYSIGREKRKGLANQNETPGAGQYNLKSDWSQGYSFKRGEKQAKPNVTPGYYKPMYSVPDVPKYLLPPEPQRKIHL